MSMFFYFVYAILVHIVLFVQVELVSKVNTQKHTNPETSGKVNIKHSTAQCGDESTARVLLTITGGYSSAMYFLLFKNLKNLKTKDPYMN